MKKTLYLVITLLIVISGFLVGCNSSSTPKDISDVVIRFKKETQKIEAIPLEKKNIESGDGKYTATLNFKKRATFFSKNKKEWNVLFEELEKVKNSYIGTNWHDDVLFCLALGYLRASNLNQSDYYINAALGAIMEFTGLSDETELEEWTKNELNDLIWQKLSSHFENSISEKNNLNQFFYLAKASILENKKNNIEAAINYYKKALEINADGIWGVQAKTQIQHLNQKLKIQNSN